MNKVIYFLLFGFLSLFCVSLRAQSLNNEATYLKWLDSTIQVNQKKEHNKIKSLNQPLVNRNISLTVWIVEDPKDSIIMANEKTRVDKLLMATSAYFKPMGIVFTNCIIKKIADANFWEINTGTGTLKEYSNHNVAYAPSALHITEFQYPNINDLRNTFYDKNALNLYITKRVFKIKDDKEIDMAGFAPYPSKLELNDYIIVSRDSLMWTGRDKQVLANLIGTHFGLLSTNYEYSSEPVKADILTRQTKGDRIEDTPVDNNFSFNTIENCIYQSKTTDIHGDYYIPNIGNLMSVCPESCMWGFTKGQYERMLMNYYQFKTHLR